MNGRGFARILTILLGVVAAVSLGGLITTMVLSATGEKYAEYGELPIPGSGSVELPAGEVVVSFHVRKTGQGTAVPPLHMNIEPPPGGRDPEVTEDMSGSVTWGDDVHRQVWVMQVSAAGRYDVAVDGPVAGFAEPRLAFGASRRMDGLTWVLVAVSMISADMFIAALWFQRIRKRNAEPYVPSDEGVRLEQLKTITGLRDSGALTADEFEAEKRRILEGR